MLKRVVKSLILIWGLITTSVYADDIVIKKPIGYTGEGPEQIVIQDRNLWATSNDITSEDSYGYHFQRWNNHGFLSSENPTVVDEGLIWKDSYNHKGYNSANWFSLFHDFYRDVTYYDVWADDSHHDGIWWWENDNESNHWWLDTILDTQKGRQGPCEEWYHVPSVGEWSKIIEYRAFTNGQALDWSDLKYFINATGTETFMRDLWLPFAGQCYFDFNCYNQGSEGQYWSSSPYGSDKPRSTRHLYFNLYQVCADEVHPRHLGASIRCFKNYDADSFNSYNINYTTLITILISFLIWWSVGFCICHYRTKRKSKSQ